MPQLNVLQNEIGQTVLEMAKAQKEYSVDETLAHDARIKAGELTQKYQSIFMKETLLSDKHFIHL